MGGADRLSAGEEELGDQAGNLQPGARGFSGLRLEPAPSALSGRQGASGAELPSEPGVDEREADVRSIFPPELLLPGPLSQSSQSRCALLQLRSGESARAA